MMMTAGQVRLDVRLALTNFQLTD